jgi:SAM-dependent methyltransferase
MLRDLDDLPARSVLDVGCFRGDFLDWLGPGFARFGVEPSAEARAIASGRGVDIVAHSIDELQDSGPRFGAVTLIDVIEHIPRPLASLEKLVRALLPGGRLLIFTGNTAAWSWRVGGRYYWYSRLPDHVAFFRPAWFEWAAPRLGCHIYRTKALPHGPAGLRVRVWEAAANLAYFGYRRLVDAGPWEPWLQRLPLVGRIGRWKMVWWTSARDHSLIVLEKKPRL